MLEVPPALRPDIAQPVRSEISLPRVPYHGKISVVGWRGRMAVNLKVNEHVKYWVDESLETLDAAKILLAGGKSLEASFFCNLACEKAFKAAYIKHTSEIPPKTHSLVQLAQLSALFDLMNETQKRFISRLDVFQIEGRYPQDRAKLYATTPQEEFQTILRETEVIIIWVHQTLT